MAAIKQFIEELDNHIALLRSSVEQIGRMMEWNSQRLPGLKRRRDESVAESIREMLPDTTPRSIIALEKRLPGIVTAEQVERSLEETQRILQTQLSALEAEYDPSMAAELTFNLQHELSETRESLNSLKAPLQRLKETTSVARLMESRYGRPDYRYRWYQLQYYRDWRDADEAVERARFKEWDELAEHYASQTSAVEILQESVTSLETRLATLETQRTHIEELRTDLTRVPEIVLERLRTKLRGHVEGLDPTPHWMSDVVILRSEITHMQDENAKLEETRSKYLEQMASLQKLRADAEKSQRSDVPDEYVVNLRSSQPGASDAQSTTPAVVHIHTGPSGPSFFDGLRLGEMTRYLSERAAYERGRQAERAQSASRSTYRSETYRAARNDYSGQS